MTVLYMKVSNDKYELPEIIARTTIELAEKCGVKSQTVRSAMSHAKKVGGEIIVFWECGNDKSKSYCGAVSQACCSTCKERVPIYREAEAVIDKPPQVHQMTVDEWLKG